MAAAAAAAKFRLLAFFLLIACAAVTAAADLAQDASAGGLGIVNLNLTDFEGRTQAASGQTSGIWFVAFLFGKYERPWLDEWRKAAPLAAKQDLGVIFAEIDCLTSLALCEKRFKFVSGDEIVLFRDQRMYIFQGKTYTNAYLRFIVSEYEMQKSKRVPPEFSWITEALEALKKLRETVVTPQMKKRFVQALIALSVTYWISTFTWPFAIAYIMRRRKSAPVKKNN